MNLTKEDLSAIEALLDRKLGTIESDVGTLKGDVGTLKSDVSSLKSDVEVLKSDVSSLNERVGSLEGDMRHVKVNLLENNVIPRLSTIESCYTDTYSKYKDGAEKFSNAFCDIEVMKLAIRKNSEDIEELKLKQA